MSNINLGLENRATAEMIENVIAPEADAGDGHRYMNEPEHISLLLQYGI